MAVLVCRERRRAARSAQPPFRCGRYVTEDSTAGAPTPAELTQKFEQKVKSAGSAGVTISGFKVRRSAQQSMLLFGTMAERFRVQTWQWDRALLPPLSCHPFACGVRSGSVKHTH